jgi:hypothetical protein
VDGVGLTADKKQKAELQRFFGYPGFCGEKSVVSTGCPFCGIRKTQRIGSFTAIGLKNLGTKR